MAPALFLAGSAAFFSSRLFRSLPPENHAREFWHPRNLYATISSSARCRTVGYIARLIWDGYRRRRSRDRRSRRPPFLLPPSPSSESSSSSSSSFPLSFFADSGLSSSSSAQAHIRNEVGRECKPRVVPYFARK